MRSTADQPFTPSQPSHIMRADGVFLLVAGTLGMAADLAGYIFQAGPFARLAGNPLTLGAVEAHGLGAVIGVLLLRRASTTTARWHLLAAGVHLFLATCNVLFWKLYPLMGETVAGYASTALHLAFAGGHGASLRFFRKPRNVALRLAEPEASGPSPRQY